MIRYQFMASNALLAMKGFKWATYLKRSTERFITEMIEITIWVWLGLICCMALSMALIFQIHTAIYIWIAGDRWCGHHTSQLLLPPVLEV